MDRILCTGQVTGKGTWRLENGGVLGRVLRRLLDRIDDKAVTVLSKSESLAKIW